ncbi:hypothetical protein BKA67DRAFT_521092 [Truncatella angustata]|uniref:Uncharacterized protein n=1 Tax=Truncatella angustata TaxID=152316 RepID=A0A9P8ZW91_9PEZI|nr:uncharacterized protein BKA67DRAFT_521092 [Truncatella angustata]KAH6651872.1 hypothetical protein BKA67DRAFT_521092 [Truncatella angustata]
MDSEPLASQASSHLPLEPVTGTTLFGLETTRRQGLSKKGTLKTGCTELDEQVLVDGFERGAVVGISAEEVDTGLLLGLQTVAYNLVFGPGGKAATRRAAIITHLAIPVILPMLRNVIKTQVQTKFGIGHTDVNAQVRQCLECISVSRVFDVEGLWEVLSELEEKPPAPTTEKEEIVHDLPVPAEPESSPLSSPPPSSPITELPPLRSSRVEEIEIQDSEDEGDLSSVPASPSTLEHKTLPAEEPELPIPTLAEPHHERLTYEESFTVPEIILVTHLSTLLNTLFTQRAKSSAHTTIQLLSSHLRYLSRSAGSLIMLLNTTSNTPATAVANPASTVPTTPGPPGKWSSERPLDPTLRSIFNQPPPSHVGYGAGSVALSRKNKPAFGLTFAQFLDLHLLCTRLPKTRADAANAHAPPAAPSSAATGKVRYVWIVEVLLDESGLWDGVGKRIDREQRWGAVEVKDGVRIVDAFEKKQERQHKTEMFRLAAGFGGRRV